ncbi:MAG: protease inhibitor I42 family protein [Phycisphaerae bacterium]|nr:protease inhibitor I42 family protein [Phycisphaerae bacterium]
MNASLDNQEFGDLEADLRAAAVSPGQVLRGRVLSAVRVELRPTRWRRRLRIGLELAAAAVIVIGLAVCYFTMLRDPYHLEGQAEVTDSAGQPTKLDSGAWIQTSDKPATLKIRGHTKIAIAPKTRLRIEGSAGPYRVWLDHGQVRCDTQPRSARVEIASSAGNVTGRGDSSSFKVSVEQDENTVKGENTVNRRLTVAVVAGMAMLATASGEVVLADGQTRTISPPASQPAGVMKVMLVRGKFATDGPPVEPINDQPAADWIMKAVKALPVEKRIGERVPDTVTAVTDWVAVPEGGPTQMKGAGLEIGLDVRAKGESLAVSIVLQTGDARAMLSDTLKNQPGSSHALKISSNMTGGGQGYLVMVVAGAGPAKPDIAWGETIRDIQMGISTRQATCPAGAPMEFVVSFKNVGANELKIARPDNDTWLVIESTAGRGGGNAGLWIARFDAKAAREPLAIKPGQVETINANVGGGWALTTQELGKEVRKDRLPAGEYRVRAVYAGPPWPELGGVMAMSGNALIQVVEPAPADAQLVITNADNGKTVTARVGQTIRVELKGDRANMGWEGGIARISTVLAHTGPKNVTSDEFQPAVGATDPSVGLYVFLYKAIGEGEQAMEFDYIAPGGPNLTERLRSKRIDTFKVTVKVVADELGVDIAKGGARGSTEFRFGMRGGKWTHEFGGTGVQTSGVLTAAQRDEWMKLIERTGVLTQKSDSIPAGRDVAQTSLSVTHGKKSVSLKLLNDNRTVAEFGAAIGKLIGAAPSTGQITVVGDGTLSLRILSGQAMSQPTEFKVDEKTEVMIDSKPGRLGDLKVGQWVHVLWDPNPKDAEHPRIARVVVPTD